MTDRAAAETDRKYEPAPAAIQQILAAPAPFRMHVSPDGKQLLLARPLSYPPIADLAEPMLALAGVRINPKNNGPHQPFYYVELKLKALPDGKERPVAIPAGARLRSPSWNATGTRVAFLNVTATMVQLWVLDIKTARLRRVPGLALNPMLGSTLAWMPDQQTLLVKAVARQRPAPPADPRTPRGPEVYQSTKSTTASSTYENRDLLETPHDADLFEYYATSELAFVNAASLKVKRFAAAAVYADVDPAPDGKHILVERVERPYSYLRPYWRFPAVVEIRDRSGRSLERVAELPLAEQVPIHGTRTGPRAFSWRSTAPATLLWAEALDGGDTYKKVPHHDRIMLKPVGKPAVELMRTQQRYAGIEWIDAGGLALLWDVDEDTHLITTRLVDVDDKRAAPRLVWSRNYNDKYKDPGNPIYRRNASGKYVVQVHEGAIFLRGRGATANGNRPFVDRFDLKTLKSERLFRSDLRSLEYYAGGGFDAATGSFLTLRESPTQPPNLHVRTIGARVGGTVTAGDARFASAARVLTKFTDPTPQLRHISKQLVKYKRADGIPLSFTLYLPPGYKAGTRLPTVVWAYPLDYTDDKVAGQVDAYPQEFVTIRGASPVFLALQGYAVLDDVAMPVVGPSKTAYDTFIPQIKANAKAAIDKAVELGVTDRNRVGVMGHSHGGLMTANLLAWSNLFRAGVARSGAYNHTLRPFGFQNERRTLYQAKSTYLKLSPLVNAQCIKEPLLIIHGAIDQNPGTVTQQSRKLFEALRGLGATSRLVILPFEGHGYRARESVEHVLHETVEWFDKYVKNAPPCPAKKPPKSGNSPALK